MKTLLQLLILLGLVIGSKSFADDSDYDVEVITDSANVMLNTVECIRPMTSAGKLYTRLSGFGARIILDRNNSVELTHSEATTLGCDQKRLKKLVSDSNNRFGFADATLTITKRTEKIGSTIGKICLKRFEEIVEINFGQGTILKSEESTVKPAKGCQLPYVPSTARKP